MYFASGTGSDLLCVRATSELALRQTKSWVALPSICPASFRDRFHLSAIRVYQELKLVTKHRMDLVRSQSLQSQNGNTV
jgi:hypothetical protein